MEKKGPKTIKPILLRFKGTDFKKLNESLEFQKFIYEGTLKAIKFAIKNNKKNCSVFKIEDLGSIVSIPRSKFKPVLDSMIQFYEKQSKFEKCTELVKLKEKV